MDIYTPLGVLHLNRKKRCRLNLVLKINLIFQKKALNVNKRTQGAHIQGTVQKRELNVFLKDTVEHIEGTGQKRALNVFKKDSGAHREGTGAR
jgi:hypothetical protein